MEDTLELTSRAAHLEAEEEEVGIAVAEVVTAAEVEETNTAEVNPTTTRLGIENLINHRICVFTCLIDDIFY